MTVQFFLPNVQGHRRLAVARLLPGEERAQAGGVTRVGVRCTASFGLCFYRIHGGLSNLTGFLLGDTKGFLMESCWRGAFFLLGTGLAVSMNTNRAELRSVGDPCSAMVGQRHIFAVSRLSSSLMVSSRTDPVSFVASDYTRGITRVGFIGAKRLNILSERPR
jgi:hypothetical protein